MTLAHLHLVTNHLPIIGIPLALLFLIYALWTKSVQMKKFSLWVIFALSIITLPVFKLGEEAEEAVEHHPSVSENVIEKHEEAAEVALISTLLMGGLCLASLMISKPKYHSKLLAAIVLAGVFNSGLLAYVGNLGGKIKHGVEMGAAAGGGTQEAHEEKGDDDKD